MRLKAYSWMVVVALAVMPCRLIAGANQWTRIGPDGAMIASIATDPSADGGAYVLTRGAGVFKTVDGGVHWRPTNEGLPAPEAITALLVASGDPTVLYAAAGSEVFVSQDGAEHWSRQGDVGVFGSVSCFAFDPRTRTVYAGTSNNEGVFRSLDGGKTWEQPSLTLRGSIITSLAVSSNGRVYATRATFPPEPSGMLFRTDDNGATWTAVSNSPIAEMVAVDSDTATIYVLAGRGHVVASNDAGTTWKDLTPISYYFAATSILAAGDGRIYVSSGNGVYEYDTHSAIWRAVGSLLSNTITHSLAISAFTPRRLYATKDYGLVTRVDDGSDWVPADHGLPAYALDVAVVQSEPTVIYAATIPGLFKTEDDGKSWQQVAGRTTHVALTNAHDTLFASSPSVEKTIDGGATWKTVRADFASALAVAPSDNATIYAALASGMAKSTDGGSSWTSAGAGLPTMPGYYGYYSYNVFEASSIAVDPKDPSRVYVAAAPSGIFSSVDGGVTWVSSIPKEIATSLVIDPSDTSVIYAGAQSGGVIKSINGGVTWSDALRGEAVAALTMDPTNSSVIYAGTYSGKVYRTINGGADWTPMSSGLSGEAIVKLSMNPSGNVLYAATSVGVLQYQREDALSSAVKYSVSLRTSSKNFVSAANCGGANVNANASSIGNCETFSLYDADGGKLTDGDAIYLQAANGSFVSAENGGANGCGGCQSPLNANRLVAAGWEQFTIRRANGAGEISDGDAVILMSSANNYVTAENGGANSCSCDSPVTATRTLAGEWETFVISIH